MKIEYILFNNALGKFYEQVIQPLLNQLLGQKTANARMKAIISTSPVPDDLHGLWEKMGL